MKTMFTARPAVTTVRVLLFAAVLSAAAMPELFADDRLMLPDFVAEWPELAAVLRTGETEAISALFIFPIPYSRYEFGAPAESAFVSWENFISGAAGEGGRPFAYFPAAPEELGTLDYDAVPEIEFGGAVFGLGISPELNPSWYIHETGPDGIQRDRIYVFGRIYGHTMVIEIVDEAY